MRKVVAAHRGWYRKTFEEMLAPLGLPDSGSVAEGMVMVRDGAMVAGYLGDPALVAGSLYRGCMAVIEYARR